MVEPTTDDFLKVVVRVWEEEPLEIRYPSGPAGPMFRPDATGELTERALYDDEESPFAFVATDQDPPLLFFREGEPGEWSEGIPYGRGEQGEQGPVGDTGEQGET